MRILLVTAMVDLNVRDKAKRPTLGPSRAMNFLLEERPELRKAHEKSKPAPKPKAKAKAKPKSKPTKGKGKGKGYKSAEQGKGTGKGTYKKSSKSTN